MVDPEEAKNIAIPFALLPSKDEDEQLVDKFAANLKEKHLVEKFPTQPHGWMAARYVIVSGWRADWLIDIVGRT